MRTSPLKQKTDWHQYYKRPYPLAPVSRGFLTAHLTHCLKKYLPRRKNLIIAELGGANSFIYPALRSLLHPAEYHIFDNHPSLDRLPKDKSLYFHHANILNFDHTLSADLTFSIGLIEHFSVDDMQKVIEAHTKLLKPEGISVISFPTPTWPYKAVRRLSEMFGSWIFHDERALTTQEVVSMASQQSTVLNCQIIWPMVLTQAVLAIKKTNNLACHNQYHNPNLNARLKIIKIAVPEIT
jgi:hypothetical protein